MDQLFSSRTLNLLNTVKENFIFVPYKLKEYTEIQKVVLPILTDKQTLQSIEVLRFLHHFMKFEVVLSTYKTKDDSVKKNLIIAAKLLNAAKISFTQETLGNSESTLKSQLTDLAKLSKAQLISIVNLTEENLFNLKEKSFVEDVIRNKEGLPILVIQNQNKAVFGSFHTTG